MKRINLPTGKQIEKTKFVSIIAAFAVFASVVLVLQSCKPKPEPVVETDPPEITSLSIPGGQPGATVTIKGKNFKDGTDGVTVYFGSHEATVTSSTTTKIGCTLPDNIPEGTYNVVVSIDGQSSAAFSGFTVKEKQPAATVTRFSPDGGSFGDEVTISGSNFGDDQSVIKVTINEVEQTITAFSNESITIELTPKTFSGEVAVWVDGVKYTAPDSYNYQEKYFVESFGAAVSPTSIAVDKDSNVYMTYPKSLVKYERRAT
jgi:hypothetical protein